MILAFFIQGHAVLNVHPADPTVIPSFRQKQVCNPHSTTDEDTEARDATHLPKPQLAGSTDHTLPPAPGCRARAGPFELQRRYFRNNI